MTIQDQIKVFPQLNESRFPFSLLACNYGIASSTTQPIRRTNYQSCTVEFVFEGKGVLTADNKRYQLGPNSVYILHKGGSHEYIPDRQDPWKKIFFVIDGGLMDYLFKIYDLDTVTVAENCPHLRSYFNEMFQLKSNDLHLHKQAAVIFHHLLADLHETVHTMNVSPPQSLTLFRKYLDEGIEKTITIQTYCQENQVSKAALIRRFKRYYGLTPYDYLMRKRIESAKLLLRHSTLSIKEIAYKLQFCDPYHFSNYFKSKTGLSPKNYRLADYGNS